MNNIEDCKLVESIVCEYFNMTPERLKSRERFRPLIDARMHFYYLCRTEFTGYSALSYSFIGHYMGRRDHATARNGYEKMKDLLEFDPQIRKDAKNLKQAFKDATLDWAKNTEIAAGQYTNALKEWVENLDGDLRVIANLINQDAIMEGWRQAKIKGQIEEMQKELAKAQQFPQLYSTIKQNLTNAVETQTEGV